MASPAPPPLCDDDASDNGLPLWANLLLSAGLVCLSATFSGLTLGLMSMDMTELTIVAETGAPAERHQAQQIIPLRRNGNLLLCTLLLGNTIVNSFLSILLAGITSGIIGLVASTGLILILGEIIPQAASSRHGLLLGSKTRFLTWFFIFALYIISKPISIVLDKVLGKELGTSYTRDGLRQLINMHVEGDTVKDGTLTKDEHKLLAGAMEYSQKTVADVMTKLDRVYMLESSSKLNFETMLEIYKSGYTRIPVFEGVRHNITGMLFVKDLILVDPDDEVDVRTVVSFRGTRQVRHVLDSTPLNEVFKLFKESSTHLLIAVTLRSGLTGDRLDVTKVTTAPQYILMQAEKEVTGVITLEDIIEEMIKTEIVDEHDVYTTNDQQERIKKSRDRPELATFLTLFEHKVRTATHLSRQEEQAVCAFLIARVKPFEAFKSHKATLRALVRSATLISTDEEDEGHSSPLSVNLDEELIHASAGDKIGKHRVLYKRGQQSQSFSLVLQGWVYVWAGFEEFESEVGPWSQLGALALSSASYTPDFSAATQGGACRLLQIHHADYHEALLRVQGHQSFPAMPPLSVATHRSDDGSPRESHDMRKTRPLTPQIASVRMPSSTAIRGEQESMRSTTRDDADSICLELTNPEFDPQLNQLFDSAAAAVPDHGSLSSGASDP